MIDTDKYEGHTPAPWVVKKEKHFTGERMRVWHQKNEMTPTPICLMQKTHCEPQDANARLIADAPLLLAEVERLRENNETLRKMDWEYECLWTWLAENTNLLNTIEPLMEEWNKEYDEE